MESVDEGNLDGGPMGMDGSNGDFDGMQNGPSTSASGSSSATASNSNNSICRDFMRNVCTRGKKCKFAHPEGKDEGSSAAATLLQDSIVFCHDFQNRNDCSRRNNCRFIHCRKEEEEEFKRSGYLPPHIRDQAITKGVAPDLPALYGARPICKDFLKGDCRRGRSCRFRHLSPRQYDLEMSNCYNGGYDYGSYGDAYGYGDMPVPGPPGPPGPPVGPRGAANRMAAYPSEPPNKRRRDFDPIRGSNGGGVIEGGYETQVNAADMDMLQHENMLLKSRVEELKKQVQELTTTNNFLLEQNAQLRLSVKGPQPQAIGMAPPQPAQPPVSIPISIEMPMATTSISMAPQQMGQHESRIVSYPGRL